MPTIHYLMGPCKKKSLKKPSEISIKQVYYRPVSQTHHIKNKKHIVYGVITKDSLHTIWKKITEQIQKKPHIGDIVEVHYSVSRTVPHDTHTPYYISYVYPCTPVFPPYTMQEIENYQLEDGFKTSILFAEHGEDDISTKCLKFAGPMGNFYSDLPPRYGICNSRELLGLDEKDLIVTTTNGDEIIFKKGDILQLS